jgi:hypothetical protein
MDIIISIGICGPKSPIDVILINNISGDSLPRVTINYPAFFKVQDISLEIKNEGVLWGFAPATVASPGCDSDPKPEPAGFMRISVIRHELSCK